MRSSEIGNNVWVLCICIQITFTTYCLRWNCTAANIQVNFFIIFFFCSVLFTFLVHVSGPSGMAHGRLTGAFYDEVYQHSPFFFFFSRIFSFFLVSFFCLFSIHFRRKCKRKKYCGNFCRNFIVIISDTMNSNRISMSWTEKKKNPQTGTLLQC